MNVYWKTQDLFRIHQLVTSVQSLNRSSVGLNAAHIVVPDIGDILKAGEERMLQTHFDTAGVAQTLTDVIQRDSALSVRPGTDDSRRTTAVRYADLGIVDHHRSHYSCATLLTMCMSLWWHCLI
jgi:hypothetical protein